MFERYQNRDGAGAAYNPESKEQMCQNGKAKKETSVDVRERESKESRVNCVQCEKQSKDLVDLTGWDD